MQLALMRRRKHEEFQWKWQDIYIYMRACVREFARVCVCARKNNIKMDLRELGWGDMESIDLALD
jgi:hypothetical protein